MASWLSWTLFPTLTLGHLAQTLQGGASQAMLFEITSLTVQLAILGFGLTVFFRFRNPEKTPEPIKIEPPREEPDLLLRVEQLERRWNGLLEELDDRIDRGNKAWRRVRAAQRREEISDEEEEGRDEDSQLSFEHAGGGQAKGMYPMHQGMDPTADPPHRQVAREMAHRIAFGG